MKNIASFKMEKLPYKAPVKVYTLMLLMTMATLVSLQRTGNQQPTNASPEVTGVDTPINSATTLFWLFNDSVTNPTPRLPQQFGGNNRNNFPTSTGVNTGSDSFPSSASGTNTNTNNVPSPTAINRDVFPSASGNDRNYFSSTSTLNANQNNPPSPSLVNRDSILFPSTNQNDKNPFPAPTGTNAGGDESIPSSNTLGGTTDEENSFSSFGTNEGSGSQPSSTSFIADVPNNSSPPDSNIRAVVEGRFLQIPGLADEGFGGAPGNPLRRIKCVGIGVFHGSPSKDRWCLNNCLNMPSFCPPMYCNCQYVN